MISFIRLFVGLATLGCFSLTTWAKPVTSTAPLKGAQCSQSVCTKNCDTKGLKCLITCDGKANDNCKTNLNYVTPFGVLEVRPKKASP
jgi:hypothetical protein